VGVRDGACRTPWCDAPIRHVDHTRRVADGGPTTVANSQGLCEACNLAKEAVGWQARVGPGGSVETVTPTGHRYVSRVQGPVARAPARRSGPEIGFRDLVLSA
jgi:hypothetical protein